MSRFDVSGNDRMRFTRTAVSTKRINITPGNWRGGIRL